jgi:hypothetical protein
MNVRTCICLYEDRRDCEIGLRFALVSLRRHCPRAQVKVFGPNLSRELGAWLAAFPGTELIRECDLPLRGWDVKPCCLSRLLASGFDEAIWIDSDIIVNGDFLARWQGRPADELIVAQEPAHLPHQGTANRATAWELEAERELGFTINGCVIRVTQSHRALLARWQELLMHPAYTAAQAQPMLKRPFHLTSDQDVLGALLGSRDFADVPVRVIRAGAELIHSGGVMMDTPARRLGRLLPWRPRVLFVHAIALKPWATFERRPGGRNFDWWLLRLVQETSAYIAHARDFRSEVGAVCPWLDWHTAWGRALRFCGLGNDALRGLPLACAVAVAHRLGFSRRAPSARN